MALRTPRPRPGRRPSPAAADVQRVAAAGPKSTRPPARRPPGGASRALGSPGRTPGRSPGRGPPACPRREQPAPARCPRAPQLRERGLCQSPAASAAPRRAPGTRGTQSLRVCGGRGVPAAGGAALLRAPRSEKQPGEGEGRRLCRDGGPGCPPPGPGRERVRSLRCAARPGRFGRAQPSPAGPRPFALCARLGLGRGGGEPAGEGRGAFPARRCPQHSHSRSWSLHCSIHVLCVGGRLSDLEGRSGAGRCYLWAPRVTVGLRQNPCPREAPGPVGDTDEPPFVQAG